MATLRAHPAYRRIPLIVLTSRAGDKHRQKAFSVGATDYVVKPYQEARLVSTIRERAQQSREPATV
jgi:PleD family two-component response regulator